MKRMKNTALVGLLAMGLMVVSGPWNKASAQEDGVRISYKVGDGIYFGDGNNMVHLQGRVQPRLTYTMLDGTTDTASFAVQRGKIKIDGHTFEKKLKFAFQMNLATRARATTTTVCTPVSGAADVSVATGECAGTATPVTAESTTGLAVLEDYYLDWVPSELVAVQVGQFKVPYLMQELTSSGKQQFVDRSLSTGFFNLGRDLGINLHGGLFDNHLKYAVFVMNGDGVNTLNRNNRAMLIGTRVDLPILGQYDASESDTGDSQEHNLGVGVAYVFNQPVGAPQANVAAETRNQNGTLDIGYKYKGFSFQGAAMITRAMGGSKLTNWGYNGQIGYFLVPKLFEVAVRNAGAIFSGATANQYEYALGLNYFIKGHGVKVQTDYAILQNNRGQGLNDHRVRSQLQVIF